MGQFDGVITGLLATILVASFVIIAMTTTLSDVGSRYSVNNSAKMQNLIDRSNINIDIIGNYSNSSSGTLQQNDPNQNSLWMTLGAFTTITNSFIYLPNTITGMAEVICDTIGLPWDGYMSGIFYTLVLLTFISAVAFAILKVNW